MHALIDIDILSSLTVDSLNEEIDALEKQLNILNAIRDVLLREEERMRPPLREQLTVAAKQVDSSVVEVVSHQPIEVNAPTKNTTGRSGLGLRRRQALDYLLKHGPIRCQDLAKAINISSAYLSCVLKHDWFYLVRDTCEGAYGRRHSPHKVVHLTDLGARQKGESNGNG